MSEVIEFECRYGTASFAGYAYRDELDSEDWGVRFYDKNLMPQNHLGNAHFEGQKGDIEKLEIAFMEDFLFTQFLNDYAEESISIDREGYTLLINGGNQLDINIEEVKEYDEDKNLLNAKISFKFNDIILDDDYLYELAENIDDTWGGEGHFICGYGENYIIREIDYDWFSSDYDNEQKEAVIKEMTNDIKTCFLKHLVVDKGIFIKYLI